MSARRRLPAGRVAALTLAALLASACQPAPTEDGSGATTLVEVDSASDGQSVSNTSESVALTPEFLAWVAPVDRRELASGESAFGLNALQHQINANAECLDEQGYGALADVLVSKPIPVPSESPFDDESALLPNLQVVRTGFLPPHELDLQMEAVMFLQLVGPIDSTNDEEVRATTSAVQQLYDDHYIQFGNEWGISSESLTDLVGVQANCMASIVAEPVTPNPNLASVAILQHGWIQTMHDIDASEAVAAAMKSAVGCLRSIDNEFSNVDAIDEWSEVVGSMIASSDASHDEELKTRLRSWGAEYVNCLEPVEEVRRPLRVDARDQLIQEQLPILLELQALLLDGQ